MKIGIISFPGANRTSDISNCVINFGKNVTILRDSTNLSKYDLIILPGGFTFGDKNGCGKLAAKQPIISDLIKAAKEKQHILGICNGFQILTQIGLLPGTLLPNANGRFISNLVDIEVSTNATSLTKNYNKKEIIRLPVAHYNGMYTASIETLNILKDNDQILMRYKENINGSIDNIAAICNIDKTIFGMMPHPENAYLPHHLSQDGCKLFSSILNKAIS